MTLTNQFNDLAGKIISSAELKKLLNEAGYTDDKFEINSYSPEQQAQMAEKILALPEKEQDELLELTDNIANNIYLNAASFKAVTDPVINAKDKLTTLFHLKALPKQMEAYKNNAYIDAQPLARLFAIAFDGQKLGEDYVKASRQCADHSDDKTLVRFGDGIKSIVAKKLGM